MSDPATRHETVEYRIYAVATLRKLPNAKAYCQPGFVCEACFEADHNDGCWQATLVVQRDKHDSELNNPEDWGSQAVVCKGCGRYLLL